MRFCYKPVIFIASLFVVSFFITSCNSDSQGKRKDVFPLDEKVAVPKRTAYPRIEPYGDTLKTVTIDKLLAVNVNAQANTQIQKSKDSQWLTVEYPRYNAVIYCTLTPASTQGEISKILQNRLERINLNSGGNNITTKDIPNSNGIDATLYTTKESRTTPLQFVALASNCVFSGSVFFNNVSENAPLDSLAPMVDVMRRDVTALLSTLTYVK